MQRSYATNVPVYNADSDQPAAESSSHLWAAASDAMWAICLVVLGIYLESEL